MRCKTDPMTGQNQLNEPRAAGSHPGAWRLFLEFLKLGSVAFGGPAAHAALMEQELVSRRKWLSHQQFLDFLGAVNLIPGPNSTQMTMLVGYKLRGLPGMLATGFGFIIPAALITGLLAWLYVTYGQVPAVEGLFFGLKPAVIAVIAGAILNLGQKALKGFWLGVLGVLTLGATLAGLGEIVAILGAGALGMLAFGMHTLVRGKNKPKDKPPDSGTPNDRKGNGPGKPGGGGLKGLMPLPLLATASAALASYSLLKLFWVFARIGAVLFGTGYVLVAYLDGELVEKLGWITREQLLDAIAIGQFTPGPILTAATFIGYLLDGVPGALAATAGIFLPSFVFILLLYPVIPRLRRSPYTSAFLDSVNMAAVAVMLSVTILMTIDTATDWRTALILGLALGVVFGLKKIGSVWIILGGAALGYLLQLIF
jgi:chromate transporter